MRFVVIYSLVFLVTFSALGGTRKIFCFYDMTDCSSEKAAPNLKRVAAYLKKAEADVLVLGGVSSVSELRRLRGYLGFRFAEIVKAADPESHLALLSKTKPASFQAITDQKYTIKKGVKLPVLRGFIHAVFDFNGYKLQLFSAQLKNRTKHPKYLHTNMRRYEARILKKLVSKVIKKEKTANVLVLADLNDTCGKSPVTAVYARRYGLEKRVFDIRPLDSMNVSWTFLDEKRDEYERVDYALASFALVPEITYAECRILESVGWRGFSSHRAIVVTISCVEGKLWEKEKVTKTFPHSIRSNEVSIGVKRRRGAPAPENPE